jgi:hypothetical protein
MDATVLQCTLFPFGTTRCVSVSFEKQVHRGQTCLFVISDVAKIEQLSML